MTYNIAIDGPAGAGKSTIAKRLAKELDFIYVDTGAMYRALACHVLACQVSPQDEDAVAKACEGAEVTIRYEGGAQQVILNGENVNSVIRTEESGNTASVISAYPAVRAKLLSLQRQLAERENVIMDGRDIGTVVLPDADAKIYLTASTAVRAKRRFDELVEKGQTCSLSEIEKDIEDRDYRDMHREISPLTQAKDAVLLDSSGLDIDGVISAMKEIIQRKGVQWESAR